MRASSRASQLLSKTLRSSSSTTYVCCACRHCVVRPGLARQQQNRSASTGDSSLRRLLWKSDTLDTEDLSSNPSSRERTDLQATAGNQAEKVAAQRTEYVPADTWDGLEHVGSLGNWSDQPPKPGDAFQPFTGQFTRKASTRAELVSALHQATAEVLTAQEKGRAMPTAIVEGESAIRAISSAKIVSEAGSPPFVQYSSPADRELVLGAFQQAEAKASRRSAANKPRRRGTFKEEAEAATGYSDPLDEEIEQQLELEEDMKSESLETQRAPLLRDASFYHVADEGFLAVPLNLEAKATFGIIKRFTQLSGHRLSDPVVGRCRTLGDIIQHQAIAIAPKPKNLAEKLMGKKSKLTEIPNLKVLGRRETPVDKEKEVGRWKIIEAELRSRGLPVLGRVGDS